MEPGPAAGRPHRLALRPLAPAPPHPFFPYELRLRLRFRFRPDHRNLESRFRYGGGVEAGRRRRLQARAELTARLREAFRSRGYLEVSTPAVVVSPGVDRHLDALPVTLQGPDGPQRRYLATSPEYHMKRLLAEGSGPIFQLGKAWRDGERGPLHDPEFTLVEWYRPGVDHRWLMAELEGILCELAAGEPAEGRLRRHGREVEVTPPFQRLTVREAFVAHAGIDLATASADEILETARRAGLSLPEGLAPETGAEAARDALLLTRVEPRLGHPSPLFLVDYPQDQCALAQVRADPVWPVAERFELYALGVELANGYHELVDSREQRRRIQEENAARRRLGKEPYPVDEAFLEALDRGLPPSAGCALGWDRLLLLLLDGETLSDTVSYRLEC